MIFTILFPTFIEGMHLTQETENETWTILTELPIWWRKGNFQELNGTEVASRLWTDQHMQQYGNVTTWCSRDPSIRVPHDGTQNTHRGMGHIGYTGVPRPDSKVLHSQLRSLDLQGTVDRQVDA